MDKMSIDDDIEKDEHWKPKSQEHYHSMQIPELEENRHYLGEKQQKEISEVDAAKDFVENGSAENYHDHYRDHEDDVENTCHQKCDEGNCPKGLYRCILSNETIHNILHDTPDIEDS